MIDREIFKQQMALLADRIGRTLAGPTQLEYYRHLSASLTTDQFVAAMSLAFRTVSGEFRNWPSPAELVELITPVERPSLSAAEAFERVLAVTNDPRVSIGEQLAAIQKLGASSVRAFRAVGGRREFSGVLEADVKWLRKSFVEAFTASCEGAEAERAATLALASASDQVNALVGATANALSTAPAKRLAAGGER
jgi:hypothetical protein